MNLFYYALLNNKTASPRFFILFSLLISTCCFGIGERNHPEIFNSNSLVTDDAGITAIILPSSPLCGVDTVQATIMNYGSNNLANVQINWTVLPGGAQPSNTIGLNLAPGTSITIILGTFNFSSPGTKYTINISTSLPNGVADNDPSNDPDSL